MRPEPNTSRIVAALSSATETAAIICGELAEQSNAATTKWVRQNIAVVSRILRSGLAPAPVVLPLMLAIRSTPSIAELKGDPVLWLASQTGYTAKQINQLIRTARWLYQPRYYPQNTDNRDLQAARENQAQLRELFTTNHCSAWIINTCRDQTRYLCNEAKDNGLDIITRAIERAGDYPDPETVIKDLQLQVHAANRAYKPDQGNHSYLRISPVRMGMAAIKGFCTASEARAIEKTLMALGNTALPREKRAFDGLKKLCSGQASIASTMPEAVHRINVCLTLDEYRDLSAGRQATTRDENGTTVAWRRLASEKLNPIDAITLIGEHGIQTRELGTARFFSPEQREWMLPFQSHCAHPGCNVKAGQCQAHHIRPVSAGGQTTTSNLVLVCVNHHARNDDTHIAPGRFHYDKDEHGIPYIQYHTADGKEGKREYNAPNLRSPVARVLTKVRQRR